MILGLGSKETGIRLSMVLGVAFGIGIYLFLPWYRVVEAAPVIVLSSWIWTRKTTLLCIVLYRSFQALILVICLEHKKWIHLLVLQYWGSNTLWILLCAQEICFQNQWFYMLGLVLRSVFYGCGLLLCCEQTNSQKMRFFKAFSCFLIGIFFEIIFDFIRVYQL